MVGQFYTTNYEQNIYNADAIFSDNLRAVIQHSDGSEQLQE
jgi:hypothetical protein